LNVAGFEEALQAALSIELEPGLVISVASLPGLAILKCLAWTDRHVENNKDAADLHTILSTFDCAGNQDRLFDQETQLLDAVSYDLTLAGAQLLGREMLADLLVSDMVKTASYEENAGFVLRLFDCFRGYLEARQTKTSKKKSDRT
jgi:predicted nucleotidyltransferase